MSHEDPKIIKSANKKDQTDNSLLDQMSDIAHKLRLDINEEGIIGRSMADAPEIDGLVYVDNQSQSAVNIGDVISVQITDADEYDLWGTC